MKDSERRDFLEICDDGYQRRSTILTSQMPVAHWHEQSTAQHYADLAPELANRFDVIPHGTRHLESGTMTADFRTPSVRYNPDKLAEAAYKCWQIVSL